MQTKNKKVIYGGIILVVLVILGFIFISKSDKARENTEPAPEVATTLSAALYEEKAGLFMIQFPEGWKTESVPQGEDSPSDVVLAFNTFTDTEEGVPFKTNINVIHEPAKGMNLGTYVENSKIAINEALGDQELIDTREVTLSDGTSAYILGGPFEFNTYKLRNIQLVAVYKDTAYIVTGTTLESTWSAYAEIFEKSLTSLRFK